MDSTELKITSWTHRRAQNGDPLNGLEAKALAAYTDKLSSDLSLHCEKLDQSEKYIQQLKEAIQANKNVYRKDLKQISEERDTAIHGLAYERSRHKAVLAAEQFRYKTLEAEFDEVASELADLEELILEELPYTFDDGEDPPNEAGPHECISYARDEIKELKNQVAKLTEALVDSNSKGATALAELNTVKRIHGLLGAQHAELEAFILEKLPDGYNENYQNDPFGHIEYAHDQIKEMSGIIELHEVTEEAPRKELAKLIEAAVNKGLGQSLQLQAMTEDRNKLLEKVNEEYKLRVKAEKSFSDDEWLGKHVREAVLEHYTYDELIDNELSYAEPAPRGCFSIDENQANILQVVEDLINHQYKRDYP